MRSASLTVDEYFSHLPDDRKAAMNELRNVILKNLPEGFSEIMAYGMPGYVVPHSLYPSGYHCDPSLPLGFISIASQKNFIAFYHMGMYADPNLTKWFADEYAKQCKTKLDMGKSCVRFKRTEHIPFGLIGKLAAKMSPQQWVALYESVIKR